MVSYEFLDVAFSVTTLLSIRSVYIIKHENEVANKVVFPRIQLKQETIIVSNETVSRCRRANESKMLS